MNFNSHRWSLAKGHMGNVGVDAPAEDFDLAKTYHAFEHKGRLVDGRRITILTKGTRYKYGEAIRVLHVFEAVETGTVVHVMGPKTVYGEYLDAKLVSKEKPQVFNYSGLIVPSPAVDFNYEISTYTFMDLGQHTIQWKGGDEPFQNTQGLESNMIKLEIVKP